MPEHEWRPCVVIPVFDHEHAIGAVVEQLHSQQLQSHQLQPAQLPIILVDDGSSERCRTVLQELANVHDTVTLVRLPENRGKGGAVKAGLRDAWLRGFSHALQVDADGQHDLADVNKFLAAGQQQPNAVISGCPVYGDDIPKLRYYGRYLTHVWVYINTLSLTIKDSMCGFRLYPVAAMCRLVDEEFTGNRMDFDTEVLVRWVWRDGEVVNIPTKVNYPLDGVSHFALVQDNILITKMHTRLFFGMVWRAPRILWRRFFSGAACD